MTATHGLVIGKFYPPHAGHHHLIETAAARCARVSVIVMGASAETIALEARLRWLRETHAASPHVGFVGVTDDVPVDYDDDDVWSAHVALMEAALARDAILLGRPPEEAVVDLVVTSEPYGDELARRFGARHLACDPPRSVHAVSGTAVRADLPGRWDELAAATRAGLTRRIVVLGAESTGTTTLSRALARDLRSRGGVWERTGWVPEFGREFTVGKLAVARALAARTGRPEPGVADLVWTPEDFEAIARRQRSLEDAAAAAGSPLLVCDTDAFATGVWFTRYLGGRHRTVEQVGDSRQHALYLLTDDAGVPFEQDGWRDGEHLRSWMTQEFTARLEESGRPWFLLTGSRQERLRTARSLCQGLDRWSQPGSRSRTPAHI